MTHQRYFPPVISFLKRKVVFDVIADIGCGDGHFLSAFLRNISGKKVVGIDISPVAIDVTSQNLHKEYPDQEFNMICSDALDIQKWGKKLLIVAEEKKIVISMWFLIHELSKNSADVVIGYFNNIYQMFPTVPLVICELVRHSNEILAKHCQSSIMPEYLFFHELSQQGILSWEEYQKILGAIPYRLQLERSFDEILDADGNLIPSTFVWCLAPK